MTTHQNPTQPPDPNDDPGATEAGMHGAFDDSSVDSSFQSILERLGESLGPLSGARARLRVRDLPDLDRPLSRIDDGSSHGGTIRETAPREQAPWDPPSTLLVSAKPHA